MSAAPRGSFAAAMPARAPTFRRLFVANRGEVAVRIGKACDELGIVPVFGISEGDRDAPWIDGREHVVLGPARATHSYLDAARVVQAARQRACTALHPGWGFLSENPLLASLCEAHGVTFIGPPAHVMHLMGKKNPAKRAMAQAGLALIPGSDGVLTGVEQARELADRVGYPVLIKAESGGGGRGMRIARAPGELESAYNDAQAEARAAFGDERVYLERLVEGGRHIEIQIIADKWGNVCHLGERDCTVQRNHQKLIEESPSPVLDPAERAATLAAAVHAARSIGYVGAGTMEMLYDHGTLRFMEMNCRLQVEHTVSEMRSGRDLVHAQIAVAAGQPLPWTQSEIELGGHAIECRINAEDPYKFTPSPGRVTMWHPPGGPGVRVDSHAYTNYFVPPNYDSMIGKIIVHGDTREQALARMRIALSETVVEGILTNIPLHRELMVDAKFVEGGTSIHYLEGWMSQHNR